MKASQEQDSDAIALSAILRAAKARAVPAQQPRGNCSIASGKRVVMPSPESECLTTRKPVTTQLRYRLVSMYPSFIDYGGQRTDSRNRMPCSASQECYLSPCFALRCPPGTCFSKGCRLAEYTSTHPYTSALEY